MPNPKNSSPVKPAPSGNSPKPRGSNTENEVKQKNEDIGLQTQLTEANNKIKELEAAKQEAENKQKDLQNQLNKANTEKQH
ncbi:MAG: hypothetical protein LKM43_00290 [Wolbachia endosymbiont of Penenirmus auritus]|nr:hypothetical protein [Wolbachia endosymbiont of Penenirmus auritus]